MSQGPYQPLYNSARWQRVRAHVRQRDGNRCTQCGTTRGRLDVDHIRPLSQGGDPFDLSNLRTLCRRCHNRRTHGLPRPPMVRSQEW